MAWLVLFAALACLFHFGGRLRLSHRHRHPGELPHGADRDPAWAEWIEEERRELRHWHRPRSHKSKSKSGSKNRHHGHHTPNDDDESDRVTPEDDEETALLKRARRRARAEFGFYSHLSTYFGVITFLALINVLTTSYPWVLFPAMGWGLGVFFNYMGVFGNRAIRQRYVYPAIEREVKREKAVMTTEKQASMDELSSTIAHEIRNPIAAAKSLVQQMGEDPQSVENVEYAEVALGELDRVERRISHMLRFAKEEDYDFSMVNLASVLDASLTQMRSKLDGAGIGVTRNYITGPTVQADAEKLQQVFTNVLDNAIDALDSVAEGRRIDLYIDNGGGQATVRLCDNGCGISPEKAAKMFNPFYTTKDTGTGLGMAISRKIVEAHAGSIDVASKPGDGTEMSVTLPLPQ